MNWIDFLQVKPTLHSWDNAHLVMIHLLELNPFATIILLRIFVSLFIVIMVYSFLVMSLCGFGTVIIMLASEWVRNSFLYFNFLEELHWIYTHFLLFSRISSVKLYGPGVFFVRRFSTIQIFLADLVLYRFSISFWGNFGSLFLSRNLSISPKLSHL